MKALKLMVLPVLFALIVTSDASAIGEVFQVETSGTEYCGDFQLRKFNASNNVNLWVYLQGEIDITISFTNDFQPGTTFPMSLSVNLVNNKKTSFTGMEYFEDQSFITIQGITTLDNAGTVKSLKGTFIQRGVLNPGCFSSGTFSSSKRISSLLPCTYTYGDWEPCQPNGTQARPLILSSPTGCIGVPVLSQQCVYVSPAPSKTWTVEATGIYNEATYQIILTTEPAQQRIHMTITNTSQNNAYFGIWLTDFQLGQDGHIYITGFYGTSFAGGIYNLVIPAGQTRDGYIINIPSWFNFNEGFTFVFDSQNVFYLAP